MHGHPGAAGLGRADAGKDFAMNRLRARKPCVYIAPICLALSGIAFGQATFAQNASFKPAPSSPIAVGHSPSAVAVADFNKDGKPDLAVLNTNDNSVSILLGNGDGTFTAATNSPFSTSAFLDSNAPISIAVWDFNGDGNLDLAITTISTGILSQIGGLITGQVGGGVTILLGNGDGTFYGAGPTGCPNNFGTGGDLPTGIAFGHFNTNDPNHNFVDLAVTNFNSGNISILMGDGQGNFTAAPGSPFAVGTRPSSIVRGVFNNGDGKADLAVTNAEDGTVSILLGNGDGTFQPPANISVGIRPIAIKTADLNGDGNSDLVVVDYTSSDVFVLLGKGDGTFGAPTSFGVGGEPSDVVVADFNGDFLLDLAVVNRLGNAVTILNGDGTGSFKPATFVSAGIGVQSLAFGDFNGDGALDLAVVNTASNSVSVLLNATDTTPPVTTAVPTPGPNSNGWNNSSVSVTLTSTDNETNGTGPKDIQYSINSGTPVVVAGGSATVPFSAEGVFALSYFGVDNAGNVESPHTLTVQIDETPPTITSSQSPPANAAGWNNSPVSVTFNCSDALSGVASCQTPIVVSTEGANQTVTGTATDNAGNSATTTRTVNLDETPPVLTMPTLGASYLLNSTVTLNFGATDALSGVATMQATLNGAPVTNGSTVTLNHLAANMFTLTATDVAGNTSTKTATFQVVYNFIGFLPPIPNDGTGLFKLGSTVPVKFQLTDANGTQISTAVGHLTIQMISNNTLLGTPIDATASGNADVGDLFRFDGTEYIFNWSTKPVSAGTWQLQARLDDGTVHAVVMGTK